MTIRAAIAQYLTAEISAVSGRIFRAGEAAQELTLPHITYERISGSHHRKMAAPGGAGAETSSGRWQFDIWAMSDAEAESIGETLREKLDTYRGTMGSGGDAVYIRGSFLDDDADSYTAPPDGASQAGRHRVQMDFMIWHEESLPAPNLP